MVKINIIAVGSIKEKFYVDAIKEYEKRLSRFCNLKIVEVEEQSNASSIQKKIELESQNLLKQAKGGIVLLDREGDELSSEELAKVLDAIAALKGEVSFVVGGSNGVDANLKQKAKKVVSFGKITFPHQLFRVVLLEQIYRAETILNNLPYHK